MADVSQAVEAVRKLHADRSLAKQLGANGRTFAQQFTPDLQVQRWHEVFVQLRSA